MGCARAPSTRVVLIAEDDHTVSDLIATIVEMAGATPVIAYDGHQALILARACAPALVITDLEMPRMGGAALIMALRREWRSDLPVILVSGAPRSRMLAAGADAVLTKPFDVEALLVLLAGFLLGGSAYHPAA
jgi:two-component system, OmpR family, phosphate regulon response regulator PhoB